MSLNTSTPESRDGVYFSHTSSLVAEEVAEILAELLIYKLIYLYS
jgi:hypothetical protein